MSASEAGRPVRRALVFSGGGARGAYEAGVVRYVLEEMPKRLGRPVHFDILCGTSVGAIHACYLAATADEEQGRGQNLVNFWTSMRIEEVLPVSGRDLWALPRRVLGMRRVAEAMREGAAPERLYGLLNTQSLEKVVFDAIPWRNIRSNFSEGRVHAVAVAATQIGTGRVVIFMETRDRNIPRWTRDPTLIPRPTRLLPTHALASAAIPLLFPSVRVGARYYADGGLRLNTPLAPAVRLGADRILVLGLTHELGPSVSEAIAQERTAEFGNPMFLFGKVLNALMLSPIEADVARLQFVNDILEAGTSAYGEDFLTRLNASMDPEGSRPLKRIDNLVIRPSEDLGRLAAEVVRDDPELDFGAFLGMLRRVTGAGTTAREADLLSYLLFDASYAHRCIEIGFKDAEAREAQLAAFFSDAPWHSEH